MAEGTQQREGHGWWPYLLPIFAFLAIGEVSMRVPEGVAAALLPVKVAVPAGLLLYYFGRGSYPEFRGFRPSARGVGLDVLVGIAGAAVWMAPYLLIDSVRPGAEEAFDPEQLGASLVWLTLGIRLTGYAVATPFMEELFVRSWLPRFLDVFDKPVDFRDVPIARFTWRSFVGVVILFTVGHAPWEWPVAVAWVIGTQLWFYRRKHLVPMVIVHALSNLTIFVFVILADGRLHDAQGDPIRLWFFL